MIFGHELGALAALDLAVRRPELTRGVVLIEPPMLWLVPDGTDAVGDLREAVTVAARENGAGRRGAGIPGGGRRRGRR